MATLMERMEAAERRIAELERQLREYGYPSRIPFRFIKPKVGVHQMDYADPPLTTTLLGKKLQVEGDDD